MTAEAWVALAVLLIAALIVFVSVRRWHVDMEARRRDRQEFLEIMRREELAVEQRLAEALWPDKEVA